MEELKTYKHRHGMRSLSEFCIDIWKIVDIDKFNSIEDAESFRLSLLKIRNSDSYVAPEAISYSWEKLGTLLSYFFPINDEKTGEATEIYLLFSCEKEIYEKLRYCCRNDRDMSQCLI